ncbi:MAG: sulfite exporter TauE/SafE family protein [Armatimonadota bacterium]|nr:MAG: sulfite exporter TauE/SafE family protein [Armatimonadota bacterium]
MPLPIWCFLIGIAAGSGPCFATCAPTVVSYVGGLKRGWREGLRASLVFSLARIPAYLLLGVLVAYLGTRLNEATSFHQLQSAVNVLAGALLIIAGALLAILVRPLLGCCKASPRLAPIRDVRLLAVLGFLFGLSPCAPMMAVMARVGIESATVALGAICMVLFGIGTALSPLLLLGAGSGMLSELLARRANVFEVFRRA